MTSQRPYLLKAILDWILDNSCTPYIVIETAVAGVEVPEEHVDNNRIVLNISPNAIRNFNVDQGWITFDSRFSGKIQSIAAPVGAVVAIYAQETGQGMMFELELPDNEGSTSTDDSDKSTESKTSHLQIVK